MVGSDSFYWIYDKSKNKMFKSRDVRFNENSVLKDNEKEIDIKITRLDTLINNNEDIEENIQNDENNENENDDFLNDDTNDDDSDNDNNNDLNENIWNENIEIDNNESMLKRTQKSHHNNKLQMILGKVKLILYIQKVILTFYQKNVFENQQKDMYQVKLYQKRRNQINKS
jgi:hypothetical protein